MIAKCFSTGSAANMWQITSDSGHSIFIECGLPMKEIFFNVESFKKVDACIVTHGTVASNTEKLQHLDHSRSQLELEKRGIKVYGTHNLVDNVVVDILEWRILPIQMQKQVLVNGEIVYIDTHGVKCFGYIIHNTYENKKFIYISDTNYIPKLANANYSAFVIECNYDNETVNDLFLKGELEHSGYEYHLGLNYLKEWLADMNCKQKNIVAHHLSNAHANKETIKSGLQEFAENVFVAEKGLQIEF